MKTDNDFELRDEYKRENLATAVRGRFYNPKKIPTTLPLDSDILLFLKKQASKQQLDYPLLINSLLRDYMNNFATQHPKLK
jgi:predicted DNA binding CopG/RHH family protein